MTIFDFKPYSYWKHIWTVAYVNWDTGLGDCPRTTMRVELLRLVNERQRREIEDLQSSLRDAEMEKAHWFTYARNTEKELSEENARLLIAHNLVLEEYLKLHAASMELHRLVTQTIQNAPNSCETHVLRPDAPASTPTHEIEPLAAATDDVVRLRLHPAMAEPLIFIESE